MMSIQNVRQPEVNWPLVVSQEGETREISTTEKCVIMGNKSWWGEVLVNEKAGVDKAWRSTPVTAWGAIIGELCDGFLYTPVDHLVEEGDLDSDVYGSRHSQYDGETTEP